MHTYAITIHKSQLNWGTIRCNDFCGKCNGQHCCAAATAAAAASQMPAN